MDGGGGRRRAWLAMVILLGGLFAPIAGSASAPGLACQPGSGPQLAGRTLTQAQIASYPEDGLRCADLVGANLRDLRLVQIDLAGANLRDADLQHADLTQATLNGADLSGADLADAKLIQVSARGTSFAGANLSNVDLGQADLTGADLDGANLGGTSFVQAELRHANFTGVKGVTPWSLYLLIAAAVVFVLLVWRSVGNRVGRRGGMRRKAAMPGMVGINDIGGVTSMARMPAQPGLAVGRSGLVRGLLGALVVTVGFHLFVGGLLNEFVGGFGAPVAKICSGPQCAIGVGSGFFGIFGGIIVILAGFGVRRAA